MKATNNTSREVRSFKSAQPFTLRTASDGGTRVCGYAIAWNSPSADLGGFVEICSPGMLTRTLIENPDILALRDHKQELLLGRTKAGTLQLRTDSKGLAFTLSLPNSPTGQDAAEAISRLDLDACSFGFTVVEDSWALDASGNLVRTLRDINLHEISVTSFPAYQDTSVATRSRAAEVRSKLTRRDDDEEEDDDDEDRPECDPDSPQYDPADCEDDDDEDRSCECACPSCQDGDCTGCTDDDCDEDCSACPARDAARADRLRVRSLFARRMAAL